MRCVSLFVSTVKVDDVVGAQRRHIVEMLLKGKIYGLPGSNGTVRCSISVYMLG